MILPIVFAVLIAIAHYWSDRFCKVCREFGEQMFSFVAGIATVYVFLGLYPEFYRQARFLSPYAMTSVLLGFAVLYVVDKEIYRKTSRSERRFDLEMAHGVGLMAYYLVVGIALYRLTEVSVRSGVLFFIPVFIYSGISAMSLYGLRLTDARKTELSYLEMMQGFCVLAGAFIAQFFFIPSSFMIYLVGLVAGILTYVVFRDMLPKGKQGEPLYFVVGGAIYLVLIAVLWTL
ncbi:hypothetical protein GF351_02195 [Candidatus Woesearchaeota archaeon]|nr:hypothetical protein [Candidatus Woesearchaeota archaeon]